MKGYIGQREEEVISEFSSQGTCEVTKEEFSRPGHVFSSWFLTFFFLKREMQAISFMTFIK